MTPIRRVFVTPEVFPFTAGGVGRFIANVLSAMSADERSSTLVLVVGAPLDRARFAATYPDVAFESVSEADHRPTDEDGRRFPPAWAYRHDYHFTSVLVCRKLLALTTEHRAIDYVEFPDWRGVAFAATQEKRLGLAFGGVTLSVRLHSTETVLARHESGESYRATGAVFDLERKALADCDRIVAQLEPIVAPVAEAFAFDEARLRAKVLVHAPPVVLDGREAVSSTVVPDHDTPLVFSSKLQSLKRPSLFVRGAVGLMRSVPEYSGDAYLVTHGGDAAAALRRLVPLDLVDRFHFVSGASAIERNAIIARSICVFPTVFESFCFAAYEASLLGAFPVLNGTNPAFGEGTPWADRVNCARFDGSLAGLVDVLVRSVRAPDLLHPVRPPADPPPWDDEGFVRDSETRVEPARRRPLLSVVIPHFDLGGYLLRTLESVVASDYEALEILVVDDASTDPGSRQIIESLARSRLPGLRVLQNGFNRGLAATRNIGIAASQGEYVACVDADDLVSPTFFGLAVAALEGTAEYDFVVPQTAYFTDEDEHDALGSSSFPDYATFYGESYATGLFENSFSTATCVARADTLRSLAYREDLESFEDWDLYARALAEGHRFLVTNTVEFLYRRRPDSMIHSPEAQRLTGQRLHDLRRRSSIEAHGMRLPLHVLRDPSAPIMSSCDPRPELAALTRKRHKLLRKPVAFFADSPRPFVRGLGKVVAPLIPDATIWRKLEKLERDPAAFLRDARAPLLRGLGAALGRR